MKYRHQITLSGRGIEAEFKVDEKTKDRVLDSWQKEISITIQEPNGAIHSYRLKEFATLLIEKL